MDVGCNYTTAELNELNGVIHDMLGNVFESLPIRKDGRHGYPSTKTEEAKQCTT